MTNKVRTLLLTLSLLPATLHAQSYGLDTRPVIAPYLNGKFPAGTPGSLSSWGVVNAFPNLTFPSPTKVVPQPGSNRLWVIGREGMVYWFENNAATATKTLALNLSAQVQGNNDCGLLGIAFHPQFGVPGSPNRGYIYLAYNYSPAPVPVVVQTACPTFNRLSRFILADGATTIDPASELVLISQFDDHPYHNGSDLHFGADGFLYMTCGDEGAHDDILGNAQKLNGGLFSGVLRLDVDCDPTKSHPIRRQPQVGGFPPLLWPATYTQGYYIPNDNPWQAEDGSILEEFWAIGLRSPHRMSYDAVSGKTFIGDVGQNAVEEVDVLAKGANFQWPYMEGNIRGPKVRPATLNGTDTPPLYAYGRAEGDGCIIGGIVYRGTALAAELGGKYIWVDYNSGRIFAMAWDQATPVVTQIASMVMNGQVQRPSSIGEDANHELYITTLSSTGKLWKLAKVTHAPAPTTLSATGAFTELATLTPSPSLVPYDVNAPLWSDGAAKRRWIALPSDGTPAGSAKINFAANGPWQYPPGTVFVKHFEMPNDARNPASVKRLETRFLVCVPDGVYGLTYRWRADHSDADLLATNYSENILLTNAAGVTRTQGWYYPSRDNCVACHNSNAGFVLGPKTAQLNGNFTYAPSGVVDNQLRTWAHAGFFNNPPLETDIAALPKMAIVTNETASLELRVRSYLDANCAHCHRPGGVRANWDGRFEMPLELTNIVNGPVSDSLGILRAAVAAPMHASQSVAYVRMSSLGAIKMPPLAKNVSHAEALGVFQRWINTLGGLPTSWVGEDIGSPVTKGVSTFASGVFNIQGAGEDIGGASDQFHFIWADLTGNGEVIGRVTSQTNTDPGAKAGVMMREAFDGGSRYVFLALTPSNGFTFSSRGTVDNAPAITGIPSKVPPGNWVRLVRSGDTFTAYTSANGSVWLPVGTATIPMKALIEIGFAVTSHNAAQRSVATFDNIRAVR